MRVCCDSGEDPSGGRKSRRDNQEATAKFVYRSRFHQGFQSVIPGGLETIGRSVRAIRREA